MGMASNYWTLKTGGSLAMTSQLWLQKRYPFFEQPSVIEGFWGKGDV
jgi:hypothetical protein